MKHSFSFNFWLRRDVRSDKNEGYISARITLNGKRAEIATGFKMMLTAGMLPPVV
jgi:hypothetical protein